MLRGLAKEASFQLIAAVTGEFKRTSHCQGCKQRQEQYKKSFAHSLVFWKLPVDDRIQIRTEALVAAIELQFDAQT